MNTQYNLNPYHTLNCLIAVVIMLTLSAGASAQQAFTHPLDTHGNRQGWIDFGEEAMNKRHPGFDKNFVEGEAIYNGEGPRENIHFCIADARGKLVPVSRKSIQHTRFMSINEFVHQLYDCDAPQRFALGKLEPEDAGKVVYYLAKRYKLRLRQTEDVATAPGKMGEQSMLANRQ